MSLAFPDDEYYKPLPSVEKLDKLPPPPPPPSDPRDSSYAPPMPPPKIVHESMSEDSGAQGLLPQIPVLPSLGNLDHSLNIPLTPTTPTTPMSFSAPTSPSVTEGKPKKANPLTDLIETEKLYVDQLTGIIRKVAGAWSRSNLPPPALDSMFRSVESVYKSNRSLVSRLKEMGTSNPKALGDLLMRWIDDLEAPYTAYCGNFCTGFDTWDLITSNARLPKILAAFSIATPPPAVATESGDPPVWSLDALFLLPKARLKYYRKLYNRLLKGSTPGRSDHRLLVTALEKLDRLMATVESRGSLQVASLAASATETIAPDNEDDVVIDLRTQSVIGKSGDVNPPTSIISRGSHAETVGTESRSSTRASSQTSGERMSRETASTSISRTSTATISRPISDLERRLATERTLDIFTMTLKSVRLQMSPPSLTFLREMRYTADVVIRVTPRATGQEVVYRQGHIFILSDLFLVCERIAPEDKAKIGNDGPDMWLLFPPLAGKVLRVTEVDQPDTLQVLIMRKETLFLQAESPALRDTLISEFQECIAFASSLPPPSKEPPPPVPLLPGATVNRSPSAPPQSNRDSDPSFPFNNSNNGNEDPNSTFRPQSTTQPLMHQVNGQGEYPPQRAGSQPPSRQPSTSSNFVVSPEAQIQQGIGRGPSLQAPPPNNMYPSRTSSSAQAVPGPTPSFAQDQAMPPMRQHHTPPSRQPSLGSAPHDPSMQPNFANPNMGMRGSPLPYPQSFPNQAPPGHQPFLPQQSQYGFPGGPGPGPPYQQGPRQTPSTRSLGSHYEQGSQGRPPPPMPPMPPNNGYPRGQYPSTRTNSFGSLQAPQARTLLPSLQMNARSVSVADGPSFTEPSPPNSPVEETRVHTGPVTSTISAQMKCKVFLKREHAQWKALGSAKLKLYREDPTNIKQLVVEAEDRQKTVLISTIVLTDGVERVGKTGVAVELSDKGTRTGIIYMIQLRNETSTGGLYDSLLAGSDRAH